MIAVACPAVPSGVQLVSERRVVALADDGAGTITLAVACWCGALHEVVTGRGSRTAPPPAQPAVAC